jgi:membrane fusion protein
MLRFAAYPYQKFGLQGGTVRAVSQSPSVSNHQLSTTQVQLGRQSTESIYRVSVTLDSQSINIYGTARPLMAGMALDADIMQDRRSIIEWMFEPLFAAANRSQ